MAATPALPALTRGASVALFALLATPAFAQATFTYSYNGYTAELPRDPQRVFVLDSRTGLEFAISAGLPVIATDWDGDTESHFVDDLPAGVEKFAFRNEPNAELVLNQNPDLLVVGKGWWSYWKENAMFDSGTLPVLVVDDGSGATWRQVFTDQMTAFGKGDRAAELIAGYDAAVAAARPRIAEVLAGRKVAITDVWGADQVALQVDTFSTAIARDLGIDLITAETGQATEDGYLTMSPENLTAFNDAAIVMSLWTADIAGNPMWQRIPAVANGAQYEMDIANSWGFALTATDFVADTLEAIDLLEKADSQ